MSNLVRARYCFYIAIPTFIADVYKVLQMNSM